MPRGGARPNSGSIKGSRYAARAKRKLVLPQKIVLAQKPTLPAEASISGNIELTPLDFFLELMRDIEVDVATRLKAGALAAPFVHPRLVDNRFGKGDEAKEQTAEAVKVNKFKLVVNNNDD